jgi:SPP1 family predicted phage head-tail adaptor
MQSGRLRHRITIQQNIQAQNEIGEWVDDWSEFATVWAAIEPALGKEYYAAKQIDSKVDGKIRIRYLDGLEPTMRVVWQGRILHIVSLLTVQEKKREILIMYSEALD